MNQLEALYRTHGPALLRYLRRGRGLADAEDLLQETFVRALEGRDQLRAAASPRAWLYGIARHVSLTVWRRSRPSLPLPDTLTARAPTEDPRVGEMRQAIKALPEPQREALELRLSDELSYEEIAFVQQVPVGTVRSRLHHAVRQLRLALVQESAERGTSGK